MVQLYVRDLVRTLTRPIKELKGFQKVQLEPGASQKVAFELNAESLAFYTRENRWQAEPGEFAVFVGPNSHDLSEKRFVLKHTAGTVNNNR